MRGFGFNGHGAVVGGGTPFDWFGGRLDFGVFGESDSPAYRGVVVVIGKQGVEAGVGSKGGGGSGKLEIEIVAKMASAGASVVAGWARRATGAIARRAAAKNARRACVGFIEILEGRVRSAGGDLKMKKGRTEVRR